VPRLDYLEGRLLPAPVTGALPNPGTVGLVPAAALKLGPGLTAMPAARSGLGQAARGRAQGSDTICVTVGENSAASVVHLGPVFEAMSGIQHEDGLQLSTLGNTNSRLVKADLSGTDLKLAYTPGRYGTALITVGATDADGVSVQVNVLVTVRPVLFTLPPSPAGTAGAAPAPAGAPPSGTAGTPGQTPLTVVVSEGAALSGAPSAGRIPGVPPR
jgi:hypothetical protein